METNLLLKYFQDSECPEYDLDTWEKYSRYYWFDSSLLPTEYREDCY